MKKFVATFLLVTAVAITSASAQHPQPQHEQPQHAAPAATRPRANGGHIPPAPARRAPTARPEVEHVTGGYTNSVPHVSHNHWYGRAAPSDPRYHLAHPFAAGHFAHVGASYRYSVTRVDAATHRIWFPGGFYFQIADWEWPLAQDWCWDCGDDFTVYVDEDHPGWYLLYNVNTGTYIHVQYMGD